MTQLNENGGQQDNRSTTTSEDSLNLSTDEVDVLIIGAGPAGLMLANWFNHTQVKFRILERKDTVTSAGHADGLKFLTIEMLHSIGVGDQIISLSCRVDEEACWNVDENGDLKRSIVIANIIPGLREIREITLNQGTIQRLLLENVEKARGVRIEYGKVALNVTEHEADDHPLHVTVQQVGRSQLNGGVGVNSGNEIIRTKFLVGCDGAHSWTRKFFEIPMIGQRVDSVWGVMDILPKTNFPDIRKNCMIESNQGNLLMLPREQKLARFYVPISDEHAKQGQLSVEQIDLKAIMERTKAILSPFTLESNYCNWWSTYKIGQRLAEKFSIRNRIFLAGDAAHTHSPKVGQGMNMSMQDTFNLGWKLVACLQYNADPSLLSTYESERRPVANDLLNFDRIYTQAWAKRGDEDPSRSTNRSTVLQETLSNNMYFTTGLFIHYPSSPIVKNRDNENVVAKKLVPGMRVPDFQVVNQADGIPTQLKKILRADGRFRILVFAANISLPTQFSRLTKLGEALSAKESSPLYKFTPPHAPIDSRIEVITIHSSPRAKIELLDLPPIFHPWSDDQGWDYWKVYADDADVLGVQSDAYNVCGVEPEGKGLLAVVRPDGYVGLLTAWEDLRPVEEYFAGILPSFGGKK